MDSIMFWMVRREKVLLLVVGANGATGAGGGGAGLRAALLIVISISHAYFCSMNMYTLCIRTG